METSESRRIILDSSVWIAFLRESDSQREKAKKVLHNLRDTEVVVPEYVLVEVATALKNKGYENVAKRFVAEVLKGDHSFLASSTTVLQTTMSLFINRNNEA